MQIDPRLVKRLLTVTLLSLLARPTIGRAQAPDTIAAPFDLVASKPGDAPWLPLYRLRRVEARYRRSGTWWDAYAQMRSDYEHRVGNHAMALRFDDLRWTPEDVPAELPRGVRSADAIGLLARVADTARVIMINERHHAASDRLLTLRLLSVLRKKGYRYFAAEAFAYGDSGLARRGYARERATGYYTDDPVFAAVVREALRLGYVLVPYESRRAQEDTTDGHTPQQRRDSIQARNLYEAVFRDDPSAKVLVHAGYSHVLEQASRDWSPMALYFRSLSGIDPVTVDQTRLSERSAPEYEHPAYRAAVAAGLLRDEPVVLLDSTGRTYAPAPFRVDLQVLTPTTTYGGGRPGWMMLGGTRVATDVPTPECARRVCVVEARAPAEPDDAVALDRAEAAHTTSVRLFLPSGDRARIRIRDASGAILRTTTVGDGQRRSARGIR
jgi:hypothetical protein